VRSLACERQPAGIVLAGRPARLSASGDIAYSWLAAPVKARNTRKRNLMFLVEPQQSGAMGVLACRSQATKSGRNPL
jgi:hypothetical protein